jgi:hypothetical protein
MGRKPTAQELIDAIPGSGGIVTVIAKRAGCSWHTARKWIDSYPSVLVAYENECERLLDMAESEVILAIRNHDLQMVRYYLSTKGKKRGYTERTEITGKDDGAIIIEWPGDHE